MARKSKAAPAQGELVADQAVNRIKGLLGGNGKTKSETVSASALNIKPLREKVLEVAIEGTAPLMMLRFSEKAKQKIMETQRAGSQGKSKRSRDARNFEDDFKGASYHLHDNSGYGIPAISFRHALIECCRLVDFKMTLAKQVLFVEPDGWDKYDGQPLVRIISPKEPEMTVMPVRNASGVMDLRARPMWRKWGAELRIRFDSDRFTVDDVVNLLVRAGAQNGIGEGRANSKNGPGMGYGAFRVANLKE